MDNSVKIKTVITPVKCRLRLKGKLLVKQLYVMSFDIRGI